MFSTRGRFSLFVFGGALVICASCATQLAGAADASNRVADVAVINSSVVTMDARQPEAEALAIIEGRIAAIGSRADVEPFLGPDTRIVDAGGRVIVPGFNDAHCHPEEKYPFESPYTVLSCGPEVCGSIDELVELLREKAQITPPGTWIRGRGYEDTKLGRHPTRYDLDKVSASHPIKVVHSSGHVSVFNSLALRLAEVDAETPDPAGGQFDRDASGVPNGICRESASGKVSVAGPPRPTPSELERVEGLERGLQQYVAAGVTSLQVAGTSMSSVQRYRKVQSRGGMPRIYVMLRDVDLAETLREMREHDGLGDAWLTLGAMKLFHGNSLSGRTCWLYEPYADRSGYYGIPPGRSQASLNQLVSRLHEAGVQCCIHSNGDREIDMVLDAYEAALAEFPREDHRHRIEHCSVVNQQILDRIKRLGIVLATHSYIYEHGDKMEAYGEARWDWMHPNGTAVRMGIPIAGNSDSPVSPSRPLLRMQSMVTRQSKEGKVFGALQRVSVEDALRAWTLGSAYASFQEKDKGSLEVGKLADLVLLSDDPRTVPANALGEIQVDMTMIDGLVVYDRLRQFDAIVAQQESSSSAPDSQVEGALRRIGKLGKGPHRENSGIVRSRTRDDVYWMHNDSGDEPRIYPIDRDGQVHGSDRYVTKSGVFIGGAINVDWEDIAILGDDTIVVADVGNNGNDRRDLVLYLVDEPSPTAGRTTHRRKVFFQYPDQASIPAPGNDFNYDCEGVFTIAGDVYLLSKHRSDRHTKAYRLPSLAAGERHTLELLQEFDIAGQVVRADASPDGSRLLVLTYQEVWLFDVRDRDRPLDFPIGRLPYEGEQIEAVCFDGEDKILLADEATAILYEANIDDFGPIEPQQDAR